LFATLLLVQCLHTFSAKAKDKKDKSVRAANETLHGNNFGLASNNTGWSARLDLAFEYRGNKTVIAKREHVGPLRILRPFYPEVSGACHCYLLHPPGGVVGGDQLNINIAVASDAHAVVTTPAAGKFYRSNGPLGVQRQQLQVSSGAYLEWLPQENILFSGTRAVLDTRIELIESARFFGWELTCLGRPAASELFDAGTWRGNLELWRDGRPLFIERNRFVAGDAVMQEPWGLASRNVVGTLLAVGDFSAQLTLLREIAECECGMGSCAVTQLQGVLVARYLGNQLAQARTWFESIWRVLRPVIAGDEICRPRIWDT